MTKGYTDICEDEKQLMYTRCSYVYPSGNQCSNPIPQYLDLPLCGGHCDSVEPPKLEEIAESDARNSTKSCGRIEETERDLSETVKQVPVNRTSQTLVSDHHTCT